MCEVMKLYNQYPKIKNESDPLYTMGKVVLSEYSSNNESFSLGEPLSSLCMNIISDDKVSSSTQPDDNDIETDPQKKQVSLRRPVDEELCRICGDRASGYHYNALSCEGCKGFFRRSITRHAMYSCKYEGHCEMDMWMRRKCPACRLVRCLEVGMKQECLLSDDQCKARDARRKAKQKLSVKLDTTIDEKPSSTLVFVDSDPDNSVPAWPFNFRKGDPVAKLSMHQQELIRNAVDNQQKYEYPDESYITTIITRTQRRTLPITREDGVTELGTIIPDNELSQEELQAQMFEQMALICVIMTKLIIEFAKLLPGFQELPKEDQIVLLKEASSEVTTLRASRCYDPEKKTIIFMTGLPVTEENMCALGISNYAEVAFNFFNSMYNIRADNTEYALLTAICIFSDRPGLIKPRLVEKCQEDYVSALYNYEIRKRYNGGCAFAFLLSRLTELRTISLKHSEDLLNHEMNRKFVPELVREFFCLDPDDPIISSLLD